MISIVLNLAALVWATSAIFSAIDGDPASEYCLYFILAFQALIADRISRRDA